MVSTSRDTYLEMEAFSFERALDPERDLRDV